MSNGEPVPDERPALYEDLHATQLQVQTAQNEYSSRRILDILFRYYRPQSVLDVGCGLGTWLKIAESLGVTDFQGVDGEWLTTAALQVPPERVEKRDLEKPFDLDRRVDLTICLEVAEHITEQNADTFIESLTRHAPAVLFSAAIPFQGGHGHVNERYLTYWIKKFEQRGFRPLDIVRVEIWGDSDVFSWLRLNYMFFAHEDLIAGKETLRSASLINRGPFDIVLPECYANVAKGMQDIKDLLQGGGTFYASPIDKAGNLAISKFEETPSSQPAGGGIVL